MSGGRLVWGPLGAIKSVFDPLRKRIILEPASRGMVGDEAQLTQCDPNLAQGPNSSLNFAQNWKKELLIRVVQDRSQRM